MEWRRGKRGGGGSVYIFVERRGIIWNSVGFVFLCVWASAAAAASAGGGGGGGGGVGGCVVFHMRVLLVKWWW
jgi:hypothetical protein